MPVNNPEAFPGGRRYIESIRLPVAAGVKCVKGEFAVSDGGQYVEPGKEGTGLIMLGRFARTVDNTEGLDGDKSVDVRLTNGFWANLFENDDTDPVTSSSLFLNVYLVNARSVSSSSAAGTRTVVGKCFRIEDDGMIAVKPTEL